MTDNNLKIYGADWCGFTKKLKTDLETEGQNYEKAGVNLEYINCAKDEETAKLCVDRGIKGFPTLENTCGELKAGYSPTDTNIEFAQSCSGGNVPAL